jgi:hypothetical protein
MTSQSDHSVSPEIGKLLELLNAFEEQDSLTGENFAALERLLAAGKEGAEDLVEPEVERVSESSPERQQTDDHVGAADDEERAARDEHIGQPADPFETPRSVDEEIENRFAAHIVHGMWKIKKD